MQHPNVARVVAAAADAGLSIEVSRFPEGTRTATDAARAVGCDVAQIVKSLVFLAGDVPVLALVSGADRLDASRLAQALATDPSEIRRATGDEARGATGFAIGGVPPFGQPKRLRVVMDVRLMDHETLWAAAGLPDAVFPIAPPDLARAARAEVADIAEVQPAG
jgi:prolyl-tRNA editing enzyme YbaK/EbsC (Cys-tRNA(Pro) deacylase)